MESEGSSINGAVQVACPTVVTRSGQSKLTDEPATGVSHRKPFKLRFGKEHDLGRSAVSSIKPHGLLPRLTSKFYAKEAIENDLKIKQGEINSIKQGIDNLFNQGPRQKLLLPNLESQRYGWYHNVNFSNAKPQDKRFYFGIYSSPMVKYRILILANDAASNPVRLANNNKPKN